MLVTTFIIIFLSLAIIIQFWALGDLAFTKRMESKTLWYWIVLLFPVLGAMFYFQSRKKVIRVFNPKFRT